MLERILIIALIAAGVAAIWLALRLAQRRRLHTLAGQRPLAGLVPAGRPAVVAFTLPSCVECRARQAPALDHLRRDLGDSAVITILSADAHPGLVRELGIMTVPSTLVLDAAGAVRCVNHGFADAGRLLQQLGMVAGQRS